MVYYGVAQGLDFVFLEVEEQGATANRKTNKGHDSVLAVLFVHEVSFVFGILFNFLVTEAGYIDRKFLMESCINGFFELIEVDIVIEFSLVLFGLVGLATVEDVDSGLVWQETGDVFEFV